VRGVVSFANFGSTCQVCVAKRTECATHFASAQQAVSCTTLLFELSIAQSRAPSLRMWAVSWRNTADGRSWRRIQPEIGDL
jgi:hypothetical protein